jgi:FlaA1/EpsC-like NDP-sugar epimerase
LRIYGLLAGAAILSLFGMIVIRYRGRLISGALSRIMIHRLNKHQIRERVLIVGSGRTAEHISWLMEHPTYAGKFQIVGFIDDDLMSQGMNIYGSKVIGRVEDIQRIVRKRDIGLIILADNEMASHKYREFHNTDSFSPARIVVAPDLFGSLSSLDGVSAKDKADDHLNDFQCQHCLARFTSRPVQIQDVRAFEFQNMPLMKTFPVTGNGKKWKASGQKRKSL